MAYVEHLALKHFRNYTDVELPLTSGLTVITGDNASGKTSLLEAIAFLSFGKSPRTHTDKALLMHEKAFGFIKLQAMLQNQSKIQLACQFQQNAETDSVKTQFKFNEKSVRSRSLLVGKLPSVAFFNSDLLMLRGSPSDRRSQLDMALSQMNPNYFEALKQFEQIRTQKAALLKNYLETPQPQLLEIINQQFIQQASQITQFRLQYLSQLSLKLQQTYLLLATSEKAILRLRYQSKLRNEPFEDIETLNVEELKTLFEIKLSERQQEEIRRGQVLIGPHRDDLLFEIEGQLATEFASQGQQRTIVLAFKTAVFDLLSQQWLQEKPILLLDDVMAELDPIRQETLLTLFEPKTQVLMTTTHLDKHLPFLQAFKHHFKYDEPMPFTHLEVTHGTLCQKSHAFSE